MCPIRKSNKIASGGSLAFHLWNQWLLPLTSVTFAWALVWLNGDSSFQSQVRIVLHRFASLMILLPCISLCTLQQLCFDWLRTGITLAGLPLASPTSQTELMGCHRRSKLYFRQLSQLEHLGGIQGCSGASWCHCKVAVSSQRSWTLEKLVYDWKNANSSWKGKQDKPLRACSHLASEEQKSAKPNVVWVKFFQSSQSGALSGWLVWATFHCFWGGREMKCQSWLLTVTLSFFESTDQ